MKKKKPEGISAYPLQWPTGWKRTAPSDRKQSRYQVTMDDAMDDLFFELTALANCDAYDIVLSTNVPLRRDGLPYASSGREPGDPGVAVYWIDEAGEQKVIACDAWLTVRENIRACGLAIQGLRLISRTQASEIVAHAFTGFAALPASTEVSMPSWATELGFSPLEVMRGINAEEIERAYRTRAVDVHPDAPYGNHDKMVKLNSARDAALAAIRMTNPGPRSA